MEKRRVAIVTGANRGIGFEITKQLLARGLEVVMTSRDERKGQQAVESLKGLGGKLVFHRLDVREPESIAVLAAFVKKKYGQADVLINNAGVFLDGENSSLEATSAFKTKAETIRHTFQTNTLGPFLMCQAFIPLMKKSGYGRVVNLSSGMGQLSDMNGGYAAYRISKTALNAVTRIFADELKGTNVLINSMCPGWVKTEMGGANATRSVEEGADTAVWLATLPDNGPSGKFFRDRKEMPW